MSICAICLSHESSQKVKWRDYHDQNLTFCDIKVCKLMSTVESKEKRLTRRGETDKK